jgi:hypothetical protein
MLFVPRTWIVVLTAAVVFSAVSIYVVASAIYGRTTFIILAWVLLFPLGYYYLTFPREKSIFTLDRAVVGLLLVAALFSLKNSHRIVWTGGKTAVVTWCLFVVGMLLSLQQSANPLGKCKELLDVFVFPGVVAWYLVRHFPVRQHVLAIHCVTCIMSVYVAAIGCAELITGQDLLPFDTAIFLVEGTGLKRINGPFSTNSSFALIGLISFCFLLFLRRAAGLSMPRWQRALHVVGLSSALAIAAMPMFRSIFITIALILMFEFYLDKRATVRAAIAGIALLGTAGFLYFERRAPEMFEYRISDPSDVYARIAQQQQAWKLFLAHPLVGVGYGNYMEAAYNFPTVSYKGVDSVDSAHNTLGSILVEAGLSALVPFVAAQFVVVAAFWRLRLRRTPEARLTITLFTYVFLTYWITGVSLTSGYYSDLNMWYMFVLAFMYKFAVSSRLHRASGPIPVNCPLFV